MVLAVSVLSHPGRTGDGGRAGRGAVGRRHCRRGRAGQRLGIVRVVAERHLDLDGLAHVCGHQHVGRDGGPADRRVVGQPLVGEGGIGQPVRVGDARGARRQRLSHLGRTSDGGRAGRGAVGRRHYQSRLGGQRLGIPPVVGERHPDLDTRVCVSGHQSVGGARRPADV